MKHNYKVFGSEPVSIVVEMGLGSTLSEWIPVAKKLADHYGVLLYERAGINKSEASGEERTPRHIAAELHTLLGTIEHQDKVILLAHSQGGLYAQQFCRMYPDMVRGLILLDPLSAKDYLFKERLTTKEYKQSGVDKSVFFKIMYRLARMKLGFITKQLSRNAPPLYYYKDYSKEEVEDILDCMKNAEHAKTVLLENEEAHKRENLDELSSPDGFPDIPLVLITHSSPAAIEENMKFGHNTREFATKVEEMWQEIMKQYLEFSSQSSWMQSEKSTHYIHLLDYEMVRKAVEGI